MEYYRELVRVVSLKINSNVYPIKNTNSHYLLLNTTIIPLCNGKISLIFFVRDHSSCTFLKKLPKLRIAKLNLKIGIGDHAK